MIPLVIDFTGRQVVIFGGGEVAARKAGRFCQEADVLIVSRSIGYHCAALPVRVCKKDIGTLSDAEIEELTAPAFLVIGALPDPVLNDRIGQICKKQGILFNNADGTPGDVIIPAVTGGDHYLIAFSTGGDSPAVSRFLREEIESRFPSLDAMIELQHRLRDHLKNSDMPQDRRSAVLHAVLRDTAIWDDLVKSPEHVWTEVQQRYLHD
ncbi:MAG: bifunctional precorrin-2 dehydrogenase/sirohydrochlorin ferrochelatase [Methanoregula sp.]